MNARIQRPIEETISGMMARLPRLFVPLICGLLACSARDLSPLHNGVRTADGGKSGSAGSNAGGGGSAIAGHANSASGSSGGVSSTHASAGASGTVNGGANGSTIYSTTGLVLAPANSMGPWNFDSPEKTLNGDWTPNTGKTRVGWTPEGAAVPLGALVIEGATKLRPEAVHILLPTSGGPAVGDSVNLATYTYFVSAKAATDPVDAQLFLVDAAYQRGNVANVTFDATNWTTTSFKLADSSASTFAYDVTKVMELGIALSGSGVLLVDRAWLVNDAAGDAGTGDTGR